MLRRIVFLGHRIAMRHFFSNYKMEPDDIRRAILQSIWERIGVGEVLSIPSQILRRIVERH